MLKFVDNILSPEHPPKLDQRCDGEDATDNPIQEFLMSV